MFYHVVLLTLSEAADEAFHARVHDYVRRIRETAEGLVSYDFLPNLAERRKDYTHAVISVFETSAAHDAYQASPVHAEMKAFMMEAITDLVACDSDAGAVMGTGTRADG